MFFRILFEWKFKYESFCMKMLLNIVELCIYDLIIVPTYHPLYLQ